MAAQTRRFRRAFQGAYQKLDPAAAWTRDTVRRVLTQTFERTVDASRRLHDSFEDGLLSRLRDLEVPATRTGVALDLPLEARDELAARIAKAHCSLAAVSCGAAEAVPFAGLAIELITLAELNVVQVDQIARAYGFELGNLPPRIAKHVPMGGARALLLVPILAALQVKALERDGDLESVGALIVGAAKRAEWQALTGRLAAAAALGLLKRVATKPFRRMIPFAGSAIAAWSGYRFTEAVGDEARRYFRDLAAGTVTVRGRKIS
jgi:uncharacterized protein (DUF697 family)